MDQPMLYYKPYMRYGDLTYKEIKEASRKGWLVVVPTGCIEQQGPHLPVDIDTWFVEQVTNAASIQAEHEFGIFSVVLPTIPFGPTPEHRNYRSGYVHIPKELHEHLVGAILVSLAEQGFKRIVVWRGCGQHDLRHTILNFNRGSLNQAHAFLPELPYQEIMEQIAPNIPGGHADSFITSITLFLRPDAVRKNKIPAPVNNQIDWDNPALDFSRYSSSGVIGDPSHSSSELGKRLWDATVQSVASTLKNLAVQDIGF